MTNIASGDLTWSTALLRQHTPLFISFLVAGQTPEHILRHTGLPVKLRHIRRSGIALQYAQAELAEARSVVHRQVRDSGLRFFDDFSRRCMASCKTLLRAAGNIAGQPSHQSGDGGALEILLRPYFDAAVALASFLIMVIIVQFELETFLEEFVTERTGSSRERDSILAALKMAIEPTREIGNLVGLLELGQAVQSQVADYFDWIAADPTYLLTRIATVYPAIWQRVCEYEEGYGWMGRMYYAGDPISVTDIVLRLQNILHYNCEQRLAAINVRREEQMAKRERAVECLNDVDAKKLADIVSRYMHLRSERLDVYFMAHELVVEKLRTAGHALGLAGPDDIIYLDWREIIPALRDHSKVGGLQACANARRDGFEFIAINGVTRWIAPRDNRRTADAVGLAGGDSEQLVGVAACAGQVQGRVRLVLDDQDMQNMEPGEILVTTMTTPSLMLAVEKAAGIVTDEGGMLCHAAIVSREFGIPCVIGTNEATRHLRTGDTVTLLGDQGRVQIVSREG